MAKKKRASIVGRLEETVSDMANAVSVAATGSEISILELAAEDELNPQSSRKSMRKTKTAAKKRKDTTKKESKLVKRKRSGRRRKR